ncbi:exonuclease domain-containing protein [Tomitella biformata]|uniref:exonuclease domain-containing protein n=1 Tax=Tomitella biformata TaxID=630403 RepID=UPI00130EC9E2|nr:exonuclease domain-containing protein [Tomitella biformata]
MLAAAVGESQIINLGTVAAVHVRQPSMLSAGWIQICVGRPRLPLTKNAASVDPHTVHFTRSQRGQMAGFAAYLHALIAHNQGHTRVPLPASAQTEPDHSIPAAPALEISVRSTSGPSFVGFDVETANSARGSICAIGLTVVEAGETTATHSWLCQPPPGLESFNAGNVLVHGITADAVAGQPTFRQRLGDLLDVVGYLPLIAHNAAFDIGALREASAAESLSWRPLDYACTLQWARRDLPELANHKLPTVAAALGVELLHHHDASADAAAAAGIALQLMRRRDVTTVPGYVIASGITLGRATVDSATPPKDTYREGVPASETLRQVTSPPDPVKNADPAHPLHGHIVVITGSLRGMSREDAWRQLAACGAKVNKTITHRTSVLIAGTWFDEYDRPQVDEDVATARHHRAAGRPLVIIDQQQMSELIAGDRSVSLPDRSSPSRVDAYALADDSHVNPQSRVGTRQQVRGKHFLAWMPVVKQLKRDNRLDEALTLLLECIEAVEAEYRPLEWPAPGWTREAAIVYRKQKDIAGEVGILQRWVDAAQATGKPPSPTHSIIQRLAKARALLGAE